MTRPAAAVLAAKSLTVGYHHNPVLDNIDLVAEPGMSIALVGTNGSGKTTLLKTLVGLLPALSGTVSLFGQAPGAQPEDLAYVGQYPPTASSLPLRAIDVVRTGRYGRLGLFGRFKTADHEAVQSAMNRLDVSGLAQRPVRSLSGGQRQRVYLAQAFAHQARLMVLDEPTAGLDAGARERFLTAVAQVCHNGTVVITATHDLAEASACDHVMLLAGRVVAQGAPQDVLTGQRLLEAFGVALLNVEHDGHVDYLHSEHPHGH